MSLEAVVGDVLRACGVHEEYVAPEQWKDAEGVIRRACEEAVAVERAWWESRVQTLANSLRGQVPDRREGFNAAIVVLDLWLDDRARGAK